MLRMERLSSGVLLCIFWGEVARVDIHLKAETLHFGLGTNAQGGFFKKLRDSKGVTVQNTVALESGHWRAASPRTLNVAVFADSVRKKLDLSPALTSAQFALQMVEGVENIIFSSPKP